MAAVSTIVAVASAVGGFVSQQKAAKQAKKSNQLQAAAASKQARADEIAQARERRRVLKEARQRAATSRQASANQGVESSSAAVGGLASIATQGYAGVNYLDRTGELTNQSNQLLIQSSVAQGKSYSAQGQASMFGQLGDFAGKYAEKIDTTIGTIFD